MDTGILSGVHLLSGISVLKMLWAFFISPLFSTCAWWWESYYKYLSVCVSFLYIDRGHQRSSWCFCKHGSGKMGIFVSLTPLWTRWLEIMLVFVMSSVKHWFLNCMHKEFTVLVMDLCNYLCMVIMSSSRLS